MFITRTRHERELLAAYRIAEQEKLKFNAMLTQWNELVRRINAHGGEAIFSPRQVVVTQSPFSKDEFRKLLALCHPDKHDGKPIAVEMTQKLLEIRGAKS